MFSTRTIVVSVGVGTLIALLASLRPAFARRGSSRSPRSARAPCCPPSRFARYAVRVVGRRLRGRGRALLPTASSHDGLEMSVRILALVAGVLLLFVGVAMIASRLVRPLAVLGAPGARFGGAAGGWRRRTQCATRRERRRRRRR